MVAKTHACFGDLFTQGFWELLHIATICAHQHFALYLITKLKAILHHFWTF